MLGIQDKWVALAYVLCLASAVLCVIYGFFTWNKGDLTQPSPEDRQWAQEEEKVEEEL